MDNTRRELLKALPACVAGTVLLKPDEAPTTAAKLSIFPVQAVYAPLQKLAVKNIPAGARVRVTDGDGNQYFQSRAAGDVEFTVGGALGTHTIAALDSQGRTVGQAHFHLNCETAIEDEGGFYARLLEMLRWTMESWEGDAPIRAARFNGKTYYFFVPWLRDHTHTLKGLKYFWPQIKSAVDLYADTQRPDGMIFDNVYHRAPADYSYWDWILTDGDFILPSKDRRWEMHRQPVEADVEYLFVEAIYFTWKATGDDAWMKGKLDQAIKAVRYSMTDPYRWSKQYQLIKRAYTIDTWDFVPDGDRIRGQNQLVDPKTTKFGIMFGDNTGMIAACRYLAEMLDHDGRTEEATRHRKFAEELQKRLDALAWNGRFYRHHVSEDPGFVRDLGVDESEQVSLSNAYSLNRGITHEQATAIIQTYQRIRKEMPTGAPGEFFAIYPPYRKGFDQDNLMWEYMNAGVLSIVAGEVARGAFEHGFEDYAVDILRRQKQVAENHNGYLPVALRGKPPEWPQRRFDIIDLRPIANVDFGSGADGVPGWLNEKDNNFEHMPTGRQRFEGVPFDVIDPAGNGRKACVGLGWDPGYLNSAALKVQKNAASVYLLHTAGKAQPTYGSIRFLYDDGTDAVIWVDGNTLGSWWEPSDLKQARVAWHGPNQLFGSVGTYVAGYANPHPEKIITRLEFAPLRAPAKWLILGVTVSDAPVFFMPKDDVSFGIPDSWGAAAVCYALVEGLAGVQDKGVAFNRARIAPRWSAAQVSSVRAAIRYAASEGYVMYSYRHDVSGRRLTMELTGNAEKFELAVLLPSGVSASRVAVDGAGVAFKTSAIEQSNYVSFEVAAGVHSIEIVG